MADAILVLNAGSSSIKFSLFERRRRRELALSSRGQIEGIGTAPRFAAKDAGGARPSTRRLGAGDALDAARRARRPRRLAARAPRRTRLVGGRPPRRAWRPRLRRAGARRRRGRSTTLETLVPLAPLHQPHNLAPIRVARASAARSCRRSPASTPRFHRGQPAVAQTFALPRELTRAGVRRYGFHGLSYEYIARVLPRGRRPSSPTGASVVAHLGSGASMCAMQDGRSVDEHDGLHGARRPADGHAPRRSSIPAWCSTSWTSGGMDARRDRAPALPRVGPARACRASASDMRDAAGERRIRAPRWRSTSSSIASRASSASLAAALGGLDAHRVHRRHRRERARPSAGASCARCRLAGRRARRRAPTPTTGRASAPRASRVAGLGHPDRRGADDRPPHAAACCASTLTPPQGDRA